MSDSAFPGFAAGAAATAVPNAFFTALLPALRDPAELIVTCYCFYALGRQRSAPRLISAAQLAAEAPLMRALAGLEEEPQLALERGLRLAAARGTLLQARRRDEAGSDRAESVFLLNTEQARRLLNQPGALLVPAPDEPLAPALPRRNIYRLYEENIGTIAPLLVDALAEAEDRYPASWIEAAFHEAVARNRRSWSYISSILERWKIEGPNHETIGGSAAGGAGGRRRSLAGSYWHLVRRAPDR